MTGSLRNYKSAEENLELFSAEVERLISAGYVTQFENWDQLKATFQHVIMSSVAALIKERDDGTYKVRIIFDMLRSMVNSFVKLSGSFCLVWWTP